MVNNEVIFESVELVNRLYEESLYPLDESMEEFKHKVAKVINQLYLKLMDFLDKSAEQISLAIKGATRIDKFLKSKPDKKEVNKNIQNLTDAASSSVFLYPQWVELFDITKIVHYCFDNNLIMDPDTGQSTGHFKNKEEINKNAKYFDADRIKLKDELDELNKNTKTGLYNPDDTIDIVIKKFFPEGMGLNKNQFILKFYTHNSYRISGTLDTKLFITGLHKYYMNGKLEKLKTNLTKLKKMAREKYRNDLLELNKDKKVNKNEILRIKSAYITSMRFISWYNAIWSSQIKLMNKLVRLSEVK